MIRFHLDESMPNAVAAGLLERNRDCSVSKEVGLVGATDHEQLAFAKLDQRVIVTRDQDFLSIAAQSTDHAGIVYWTQKRHLGQLVRELDVLATATSAEEMHGVVLYCR